MTAAQRIKCVNTDARPAVYKRDMDERRMRVLVMGTGSIGGVVAGTLAEAGADVTAVSSNDAIRAAIERDGFRLREGGENRVVRGRVVSVPPLGERFDVIALATQP